MMAILFGSLLLSGASLQALRATLRLRGAVPAHLDALVLPALVWAAWVLLLVLRVPHTALIDSGHGLALGGSLVLVTLVCAVLPARWWWARRQVAARA
ncbi:hypothetical protein [Isoalcanivorax indicus]|uniref:hypothetical protein n=1 Tax=Isoalcanivorax indicus TaxID=2202653 RepID=UPI000DBA24E2|nr:hypothetical protein [Isoalcanivorax indicus]